MKKNTFVKTFLSAALCFLVAGSAHSQVFEKGTKVIDAGFQLQDYAIPIFANFEIGVTDDIGVGAKLSFARKDYTNMITLQGIGNYHFNRLLNLSNDKVDLFGSLGLGINMERYSEYGFSDSYNSFLITPGAGGRYYFTEKIGAFGKIAVDIYKYRIYSHNEFNFLLGVSFRI